MDKLILTQNLYRLIEPEPYFLLTSFLILTWAFYKVFLNDVTEERHKSIRRQFKDIFRHFLFLSAAFSIFTVVATAFQLQETKLVGGLALFTMVWGMVVFVRTFRLLILMYLFLSSMEAGVPVLIVNIFSLILSLGFLIWMANQIFGLDVAPLLATSAALSVILGLALQDTLGNLFAGVSLQMDQNFRIGDWLEVQSGIQRATGQVKEISWRATLLIGLSDEHVLLPNRYLANAQISNFGNGEHAIQRTQIFRLAHEVDAQVVKKVLGESMNKLPGVLQYPEPYAYIAENTDQGVLVKLLYFIGNYGHQWRVGDQVLERALQALHQNGIELSPHKILVLSQT